MVTALRAHDGLGFFIQNGGYEYTAALSVVSLALVLAGGQVRIAWMRSSDCSGSCGKN